MLDKLVYVCSPYAGDIVGNTERAKGYSRQVVDAGFVPVTPHLLYPQFIDEATEREKGLFCGMALLEMCAEVWVFGDHISSGMEAEIRRARELDKRVMYVRKWGREEEIVP